MNSIKAFLKAKGLYLVCLALVFAATITGIAAIRSVVRGVEDLTRIQKQALEEGTDVWDSPDAAVNQPAQDVPVATAQPSPAPSAAGSASSSLQQGAGQSGNASGGTGSSAASSAQQGTLPHAGWNGKVSQAFSGNTLVYNPTLGDWRTHNGADYTAEQPAPAWTRKRINTGNAAAPWMVRRHCSAMNSDKLLKNTLLASKYR